MYRNGNFAGIEAELRSLASSGIRPGLARLARFLSLAGNPERRFKAVHIAGTNGKGSTAATLASILGEAGYKTALYTSPHLVSFGERLIIGGAEAAPEVWKESIDAARNIIENNSYLKQDRLTYFELVTAIAFMITAEAKPDIAVIEAGMGGRLDATNIMPNVLLTLITPIGLDHCEYLGGTIESVAAEKFAIMRKNTPAIFAGGCDSVEELFFKRAWRVGANAQVLRRMCSSKTVNVDMDGTSFYIETECMRSDYHTRLIGTHQAGNAVMAITAATLLSKKYNKIDFPALYNGTVNTKWPGRYELISKAPALIVDGAHNPHAMKRFAETTKAVWKDRRVNIIFAMMKDKDITRTAAELNALDADIYCTEIPGMERSMKAGELLNKAKDAGLKTAGMYALPEEALRAALSPDTPTICCGSLFLAGYVKALYTLP